MLRGDRIPRARDVMTTKLTCLNEDEFVYDAVKKLLARNISGAPVIDDKRRLVGVLSEKDCIRAAMRAYHDGVPSPRVGQVMTRDPVSVKEDTNVVTVAHMFATSPFRRVPVVRGENILVGQISRRDLLKAVASVLEPAASHKAAPLYLSALDDITAEITLG